jgi:hypothetical protein
LAGRVLQLTPKWPSERRRRRRPPSRGLRQWGAPAPRLFARSNSGNGGRLPLGCFLGGRIPSEALRKSTWEWGISRNHLRPEAAIPMQGGAHEHLASFRAGDFFRVPEPFLFCWVEPRARACYLAKWAAVSGPLRRMHTAVPPNFRCTYLSLMWHECALEPPPKAGHALIQL